MGFRARKSYGNSRMDNCPFCGGGAFSKNEQGVPVCTDHKKTLVEDIKCVCGGWLDVREGKWGPYCLCGNCGPMNWNKAMAMNDTN